MLGTEKTFCYNEDIVMMFVVTGVDLYMDTYKCIPFQFSQATLYIRFLWWVNHFPEKGVSSENRKLGLSCECSLVLLSCFQKLLNAWMAKSCLAKSCRDGRMRTSRMQKQDQRKKKAWFCHVLLKRTPERRSRWVTRVSNTSRGKISLWHYTLHFNKYGDLAGRFTG